MCIFKSSPNWSADILIRHFGITTFAYERYAHPGKPAPPRVTTTARAHIAEKTTFPKFLKKVPTFFLILDTKELDAKLPSLPLGGIGMKSERHFTETTNMSSKPES
jgi:hypothetical protein